MCLLIATVLFAATHGYSQEESKANEEKKESLQERFSKADPEDITNENFPDLVESFDYPNAEIEDVIKAISQLTGKNFILEPGVKGKITIIAPTQITVAEAYNAFLSALAGLGYTIVPSGEFLKIKNARDAQKDSIETYSGAYFPNTDQIITKIIKLKYISAEEVDKQLRFLPSKYGDMRAYAPTNSLIVTDFGSNIERIVDILDELDVQSFKERLEVIPIRYAKAKDIADLIDQIINKDSNSSRRRGGSRFSRSSQAQDTGSSGSVNYSLVIPDDRTNSIIVVGNDAGIEEMKNLIKKLDFRLNPADTGGVYVYYVKHGDAKKIADTLNGVAQEAKKAQDQGARGNGQSPSSRFRPPSFDGGDFNPFDAEGSGSVGAIFGGEVKINSDEDTNSLIITASKQDYQVIERLLAQIDIPREQVFVKVVIMDMDASIDNVYGMNFYKFDENSNGIGRIGFVGEDSVASLINPANDKGAILGFGSGNIVKLGENAGQAAGLEVTSLAVFIKFLQSSVGANVLSEPQIMALDNQEAEIEVGANVPVGTTNTTAGTGVVSQGIDRQDATIHLKIKPYISPDSDLVKMDIEQKINQVSPSRVEAANLAESAIAITKRTLKTSIVVNDGDTAVLGGLMQDAENETVSKIPVLGDIPILGWLFKYRKVSKQKKNLMLFITPNIMRDLQESNDLLTDKIDERIDFIQRYMNGEDPHGQYIDRLPRKASNTNSLSEELNSPPMESPAPESL